MDTSPENARLLDDSFTVTGRSKSRLSKELFAMMSANTQLPRYVREAMEDLENPLEKLEGLHLGMDFATIKNRAVAALVNYGNKGHMVIKHLYPEDMHLSGMSVDLMVIDEFGLIEPMEMERLDKPVKQNGRDASYLSLDPTKNHHRYRK